MDKIGTRLALKDRVEICTSQMLTTICMLCGGEEMEDLVTRQLAITSQLQAILGATRKSSWEDFVAEGIKLAQDTRDETPEEFKL